MNLEGRLLGNRYEIIEKIGNGGMATVYKARCHVLNRYVAVKILRDEFTTDQEFIRRFDTEAQSAASLTHPNIVSVYDVGHEGNLYYIVMELIQGKTLKEIINEDGALAWKWSVNVAMQIASALETAHKNNIIHRDIKPHNIIITEDGIAKVTDFGIAKAVSNSTITAFGTTIGSVHYFSPEHARGGYTDAKSDIYSLGVVMYEMLTGKVPFDADTPVSVALKHMQENPIEPIVLNPTIPVAVNKIIMKAMQKDSNYRYSNATEMLRELSMALKNPDGDFVSMNTMQHEFPTQKLSAVYEKTIQDRIKEKDQTRNKKEKGLKKFIKNHKALAILIGIILLFTLSLGGTYLALSSSKVADVQIPELVGKLDLEAKMIAEEAKLVYEVEKEEYSENVEKGKIISQDPKYIPNYTIKEKSTIKVVVSKGQKIVTVPKVTGKTKEDAIDELEKLELKVEVVEEPSKKVEEGIVISQDIAQNTETKAGATVKITVSTGVEMSTVPNLVGKSEEEAKSAIEEAGLTLNAVATTEDTSKDNGIVVKQSLDIGSSVEKGSNITITVNKIEELIDGNVTVNLKSLLNYTPKTTSKNTAGNTTTTENEVETAKLEIKVNDERVYYNEKEKKDATAVKANFAGKGTVTIKVIVDGATKATKNLNLKNETSITIE